MAKYGVNLNTITKTGETTLMKAVDREWIWMINYLLASTNNNSINWQNKNGDTALHIACQKRNLKIVEILIKAGADTSKLNKKMIAFIQ